MVADESAPAQLSSVAEPAAPPAKPAKAEKSDKVKAAVMVEPPASLPLAQTALGAISTVAALIST